MKRVVSLLLAGLLLFALAGAAFADSAFFCRICGQQIPADSRFCCYCGESVVTLQPEVTVELPVQAPSSDYERPAAAKPEQPAVQAQAISADVITAPAPAAVQGPFNTSSFPTAAPGKVSVTKSPTSESVPYGGAAIFIARAANATGITWYLADPDASTVYNVSEAPQYIYGLTVYGQGTDTLTLCGIPSWMNGWQVQAGFSGEGGPVYSAIANIWTYQQTVTCSEPVYDPCCCCPYHNCWPCYDCYPTYDCYPAYDYPSYYGPYDFGGYYPYYDPDPAYTPVSWSPSELPPGSGGWFAPADWGWGLPSAPVL